jgi:heme A synthase
MDTIRSIHGNLATTVMLFNVALAVWGLIKFFRGEQHVDGGYAGALALSPLLGAAQMSLGLLLVFSGVGLGSARLVHYLYGVLVVINIPAAFALTRGRDDRGMLLAYAITLIFTAGCGARAYVSVHGGGL